jgi:chloramphenicol O-acetyltransferase type A
MKTYLDLESWPRKEHYAFFSQMQEPFWGATVTVDCTRAYQNAKSLGCSFFIYYLHKTLAAVNQIEAFRYRGEGDKVAVYDRIDVSSTIGREDGSFGFSFIVFDPDFEVFSKNALIEVERVKNTPGLFTRTFEEANLIHFSALPWLDFTGLSHARSFTFPDTCPKISFGKMTVDADGKRTMPMSVHVHHGLADGLHVGAFVDCFQEMMNL